jgi:glycosyltransferase involved in cell wall biosynthesis
MNSHRGVHLLIEAAAELLARRPGLLRLELIGQGDEVPALQRLADQLGLADAVTWTGWLTGDDLVDHLRAATIAVAADEDNAFMRLATSTKVADYLALGLTCVVADLPENRVTGGDAVAYFRPGDSKDLARRLEQLLDSPALARDYGERGYERAASLLWCHGRDALVDAYGRLLLDESLAPHPEGALATGTVARKAAHRPTSAATDPIGRRPSKVLLSVTTSKVRPPWTSRR